jgi:hypothetical protein
MTGSENEYDRGDSGCRLSVSLTHSNLSFGWA